MNLTSKSRYAIKIMVDFALHLEEDKLQRHTISKRMGIPGDYIDHILARLRDADLIESIRGRSGGFRLKKSPEDITVWDIFDASEDSVYSVECIDTKGCAHSDYCINKAVWSEIYGEIQKSLKAKTLAAMAEVWRKSAEETTISDDEADRIINCRAPRKA